MKKLSLSNRCLFLLIVLLGGVGLCSLNCGVELAHADQLVNRAHPDLVPDDRLAGRVSFWRLVFTKYGKNTKVFHHREHPGIIYSVLDFSEFAEKYKGKQFHRKISSAVSDETKRIQRALQKLGRGKKPADEFERRIEGLFGQVRGSRSRKFKLAATKKMIRTQTGIKERFREGIVRSGRYLYALERIFRSENLPVEISRLPFVESSFDYKAYSSAGAAGIWQFMRPTGRQYLRINASLDERRDPIIATRAAARYLKNSYDKLGSWPLAITSYNHGLSGVMRGAKKVGSNNIADLIEKYDGRSFGFASKNFYTEFLAAVSVEENVERHFPGLKREAPLYFDEIYLDRALRYRDLKSASGLNSDGLFWLNRGLGKSIQAGRVRIPAGYMAKVPKGKGPSVVAKLGQGQLVSLEEGTKIAVAKRGKRARPARSSGGSSSTTRHRVRSGETIGSIARRYGVSQRSLMSTNGIRNPRSLKAGARLKIPGGGRKAAQVASKSKTSTYKVRKGDSLGKIARKHAMKLAELRKLNPRLKNTIYPGQKIVVR